MMLGTANTKSRAASARSPSAAKRSRTETRSRPGSAASCCRTAERGSRRTGTGWRSGSVTRGGWRCTPRRYAAMSRFGEATADAGAMSGFCTAGRRSFIVENNATSSAAA